MPQVNISALNGQELRQLLDSSRRRGDASLSYKVLQEMAARREAPVERGPFKARRAAEPRHIEAGLDEPAEAEMDDEDVPPMPLWRPPANESREPAPEVAASSAPRRARGKARSDSPKADAVSAAAPVDAEPPAPLDADRPLSLWEADGEGFQEEGADAPTGRSRGKAAGPRFQPIELGVPAAPRWPRFRLLAGLTLGALLGIALGWLGGWLARDAMIPPVRPAPAPIVTAALAPAPAPVPAPSAPIAVEPTLQAPADQTVAPPSSDLGPAPAPVPTPSKPSEPAPAAVPDGSVLELPAADAEEAKAVRAEKAHPALAVAKGCAGQPTPADRAICGDARLKRLQGELRRAYDEALDAHEERGLLRERQLAWRDARNTVTDPERLAQLYQARIRKLNAATAEARREH